MTSVAVFAAVLLVLVSIDDRVHDKMSSLLNGGGDSLSPLGDRFTDLGGALLGAARTQSIENAPLLVFAAVGAVLVVFMVRT